MNEEEREMRKEGMQWYEERRRRGERANEICERGDE